MFRTVSKKFIMPRYFLIFLLTMVFSAGLRAQQNSDELKRKQADIQREIDDLRKSLNDTKKNRKASLGQLALIQKRLRLREQAISNINDQIDVIQNSIGQSRMEISRLKQELDTLKRQYEKSVVYAYKNHSNYEFINFVFSASNFNDALRRVQYLKSYRAYREQQAQNIKNTDQLLHLKISGLENSRKQKDDILQKQEKEKMVLVDEKKEKDEIVGKLKTREKELSKELNNKAKADKKLRSAIAAAIRREAAKAAAELRRKEEAAAAKNNASAGSVSANASTAKTATKKASVFAATPEGERLSDIFESNRGKLPWPVEKGNIKLHFGFYEIPGTKIRGNNPGLTLETESGASVKAVFDGEVSSVFDIEGNSAVLIRHGKYFSTYSNLQSVSVSRGQAVKTGQVIGRAGVNADGNGEIEFLLNQDARNLDPEAWIRRR